MLLEQITLDKHTTLAAAIAEATAVWQRKHTEPATILIVHPLLEADALHISNLKVIAASSSKGKVSVGILS